MIKNKIFGLLLLFFSSLSVADEIRTQQITITNDSGSSLQLSKGNSADSEDTPSLSSHITIENNKSIVLQIKETLNDADGIPFQVLRIKGSDSEDYTNIISTQTLPVKTIGGGDLIEVINDDCSVRRNGEPRPWPFPNISKNNNGICLYSMISQKLTPEQQVTLKISDKCNYDLCTEYTITKWQDNND